MHSVSYLLPRAHVMVAAALLSIFSIGVVSNVEIGSVSATAGSRAFAASGIDQSFTVPSGVTSIQVYVRGGGGGSNSYNYGSPGKGAYVSAVLQVTPGQTLDLRVGSAGAMASATATYGGGGAGGTSEWWSASGGGASDIRVGGSALSDRKVIAGGGGGSAAFANGGNGGTPNGVDALRAASDGINAQGGRGGTQSAGGTGGNAAGGGCYTNNGSSGTLGTGGRGATPSPGGSGGGGGYYGGGGGGGGCNSGGGGGGSSFVDPSTTSSVVYEVVTTVTAGCIEIAWPAGTAASSCTRLATVATTTTVAATTTTAPATTTTVAATTTTAPATTTTVAATTTTVAATTTTAQATTTTVPSATTIASAVTISPASTIAVNSPSTPTLVPPKTASSATTLVAPQNAVTTTTEARVRNQALPTMTSSTIPAPDAASANPGEAAVLVDGISTSMTVSRVNNVLSMKGAGIVLTISAVDSQSEILPLDANGSIRLTGDEFLAVTVKGAKPGSDFDLWMFSTPSQLGSMKVDTNGEVNQSFEVSEDLSSGDHRVVIQTTSYAGSKASLSIGVVAGGAGNGSPIGRIIFGILFAAIAIGLIIPATRRRRRHIAQ